MKKNLLVLALVPLMIGNLCQGGEVDTNVNSTFYVYRNSGHGDKVYTPQLIGLPKTSTILDLKNLLAENEEFEYPKVESQVLRNLKSGRVLQNDNLLGSVLSLHEDPKSSHSVLLEVPSDSKKEEDKIHDQVLGMIDSATPNKDNYHIENIHDTEKLTRLINQFDEKLNEIKASKILDNESKDSLKEVIGAFKNRASGRLDELKGEEKEKFKEMIPGVEKESSGEAVEEDYSGLAELFKEEEQKESTLKKPISKMTSREIAQLKYDNLSEKDQQEIFTIALFSGLEAHRDAARKAYDAYLATKDAAKLNWSKKTVDFKKDVLKGFKELMPKHEETASTSSLKKAIEKMSGREIGALKYEHLTAEQQEKLFEMALFSGLEDYRSAARKVIDAYRATKGAAKLNWNEQLSNILAKIFKA